MSRQLVRPAFANIAGDHHFWDVVKTCADDAKKSRRDYFTFDDWDWIFRTAEYCFYQGDGFPPFMQPALARKKRAVERARAKGWTAEDLWRAEEAERTAERERQERASEPLQESPRSSRSRRRLEAQEERSA